MVALRSGRACGNTTDEDATTLQHMPLVVNSRHLQDNTRRAFTNVDSLRPFSRLVSPMFHAHVQIQRQERMPRGHRVLARGEICTAAHAHLILHRHTQAQNTPTPTHKRHRHRTQTAAISPVLARYHATLKSWHAVSLAHAMLAERAFPLRGGRYRTWPKEGVGRCGTIEIRHMQGSCSIETTQRLR
jgi:hypothetical protein